ncbi:MAG: M61 family metallopeptidase [Gemmatimonadales bacterium]
MFSAGPLVLGLLLAPGSRYAISYSFRSPEPATHLAEVSVLVEGRDADSIWFQLPTWYPGRYSIYNFAANVQEVSARCAGAMVAAPKVDKTTWRVRCPRARPVEFGYRVWWNDLNGSHSQIDSTHINLNPGNIFVYVVGHKPDPVRVRYEGPSGWQVLNGDPSPGPEYRFPNYDLMIDHPTEISAGCPVDSFMVGPVNYRVMLHTDRDPGDRHTRLVGDIEHIVRAEVALWGDPPLRSYTFLTHFLPGNGNDGMEHLTSTQISIPVSLAEMPDSEYLGELSRFGHEFFHTWNMKRLRARELGPWDYTRENPTTTLWIGEGITNYYGVRSVFRAGLWDEPRYLARVAQAVSDLQSRPGRLLMSVEQSSFNAWFLDGVTLRQKTNLRNTTISYYNKGELLGWLLDLEIRSRTDGRQTLDDVMRLMWRRFWLGATTSYYLQGHGYTNQDFLEAVNQVSGGDYTDFFRRYVAGVDELPYDTVLGKVGLRLTETSGQYALAWDPSSPTASLGRAWLDGR